MSQAGMSEEPAGKGTTLVEIPRPMQSRAEGRLAAGASEATCSFEAGGEAAVACSREEQAQTREVGCRAAGT